MRYEGRARTAGGAWTPAFALQAAPRAGLYVGDAPEGLLEVQVRAEEAGVYSAWSATRALQVRHTSTIRPPPPGILLPIEPSGVVLHWEVWSDLECAGGAQLGFLPDVTAASEEWRIEERAVVGRLTLRLTRDAQGWGLLAHGRVLHAVYAGEVVVEWRITALEDGRGESGDLTGEVRCASPILDLADLDPVQQRQADGSVELGFDLFGLLPAEHAEVALERAPLWWWRGVVEATDRQDVAYRNASPLRALQQLAEAVKGELQAVRYGADGYLVHLVQQVGANAETASLRYAKNNRAVSRTRISDPTATRVYPVLGEVEGSLPTIAAAAWPILGINVATRWVSLGEGPIAFDQQLDGRYAQPAGGGPCVQVEATEVAGQRVRLASVAGLAAGMELQFRADAAGTELTYLDYPQAQAPFGVRVRDHQRADIPDTQNLLGPGAFFDRYSATPDVADGWTAVGVVSAAEDRGGLTRRRGSASWRIVMEAAEAEVRSAWVPIRPTADDKYGSAQLACYLLHGAVRLELEVEDRGGVVHVFPAPDADEAAYTSVVNEWVENLAVAGIDVHEIGGVRARIRIRNHIAQRTEVWLDAAMLTPSPSGAEAFYMGRAACDLWKSGNDYLREKGGIEAAYQVDILDLERLYPESYAGDRLTLGAEVQVYDEELGLDVLVRCLRLARDLVHATTTEVELATRVETLSESLVEVPSVVPRRPVDPSTPRPVPRVVHTDIALGTDVATISARGNQHARALWYEELVEGVWGSRTRFERSAEGAFLVARAEAVERRFRVAASDEADILGPWAGPLVVSPVVEVVILPPQWEYARVIPAGIGRSDAYAKVSDSYGEGGTYRVWLVDDPTAPASGSVAVTGMEPEVDPTTSWTLPGGGTAKLLDNVPYHPAIASAIYLEYVSASGLTTGRKEVMLRNRLDEAIDELGRVRASSVRRALTLIDDMMGVLVLDKLPADDSESSIVYLVAPDGTGQLYRWQEGAGWVRMVRAVDLDGQVIASQIANAAVTREKILAGAVDNLRIADAAVTAAKLAAAAVQSGHIASDAVTREKVLAGAIDELRLAAGAVTAAKLAAAAVQSGHIADAAVTTAKIVAGAVNETRLAAQAVSAAKIAASAVQTTHIANDAITTPKIVAGAVQTTHIAAGSVVTDKLAAGAVTANTIAAGAVTTAALAAQAVTAGTIAAGAVTAVKLAAGSVEADKIAAGAVVAGKLAADAVTATTIASNAVTAAKISAGAVTAGKIAADAVTSTTIAANQVLATHVAAAQISASHIASRSITGDRLVAGTITAGEISANAITATHVTAGAITGAKIAADAVTAAHLAANSVTASELAANAVYAGAIQAGAVQAQAISAGAVTATAIAANAIGATHIEAGAVTAAKLNIGTLSSISSNAGILVTGTLQGQLDGLGRRPSINLGATGTQSFIDTPSFKVRADGVVTITSSDVETPSGAQSKADAAYNSAVANTTLQVATAKAQVNVKIRSTTAPSTRPDGTALREGDSWINTSPSAGGLPYSWSGSAWVAEFTIIDGGRITTGTVAAGRIEIGVGTFYQSGYDPSTKETPSGAQTKANTAQANATSYAASAASAAERAAKDYTQALPYSTSADGLGQNLLVDGSFELDPAGSPPAEGWVVELGAPVVHAVSPPSGTGAQSLYMPGDGVYHRVRSRVRIPVSPGQTYYMRCRARGQAAGGARLYIGYRGSDNVYRYALTNANVPDMAGWTLYQNTMTIPEGVTWLYVVVFNYSSNSGPAWLDDLYFGVRTTADTLGSGQLGSGVLAPDGNSIESTTGAQSKADGAREAAKTAVAVVIPSTSAPTARPDGTALRAGDIWIHTTDGNAPYVRTVAGWQRQYTRIDGGSIVTGTIDAQRITIGSGTTYASGYDPTTKETPAGSQQKANTAEVNASNYAASVANAARDAAKAAVAVVIPSATSPTVRPDGTALRSGDVWIHTTDGNAPWVWAGSWQRQYTRIDGGSIVTGNIDAQRITIGSGTTYASGYDPTTKETPSGAQSKASAAQTAATNYAASAASTAQTNATNYAASAASAAEAAARAASLDRATYLTPGQTTIDGGKITAYSVTANQIYVTDLSAISATFTGDLRLRAQTNYIRLQRADGFEYGRIETGSTSHGYSYAGIHLTNEHAFMAWDNGSHKVVMVSGAPNNVVRVSYFDLVHTTVAGVQRFNIRAFYDGPSPPAPLLYLTATGSLYIDGTYNTFTPDPPRPPAQMRARDWLEWGAEQARKPWLPKSRKGKEKTQQDEERYGKDISTMAIGSVRYLDELHRALEECNGDFARFRELLGAAR